MSELTPTTPAAPDAQASAQASAQARLDAIVNDSKHVYNTGAHGYEAAEAEVLGLRRLLLGADNRPAVVYPGGEDDRPPAARSENVPISMLYGREEFLSGFAGDVSPADRTRAADVVAACGLTYFEGQQLLNATEGPLPGPEAALDFGALWGTARDANAQLVDNELSRLLDVDEDLHDRLRPYVLRSANAANRVLAIAQRRAGLPASAREGLTRPGPETPRDDEAVDRTHPGYPFSWRDEVRR
jgi:hypothetical protein